MDAKGTKKTQSSRRNKKPGVLCVSFAPFASLFVISSNPLLCNSYFLVPNKHKVFSEIYRVLKPGGHFSISDIVLEGELPAKWKEVAELYAGCVSGAIQKEEYLSIIREAGFSNIVLQKK